MGVGVGGGKGPCESARTWREKWGLEDKGRGVGGGGWGVSVVVGGRKGCGSEDGVREENKAGEEDEFGDFEDEFGDFEEPSHTHAPTGLACTVA